MRLLNLSQNPLRGPSSSAAGYFELQWPQFERLETLIVNASFLDLNIVECLLNKMPNLKELHLASNNYSTVTFSEGFLKPSIKILYLNNNRFSSWHEICKFGRCFPNLENLVLSHNDIQDFSTNSATLSTLNCFKNLDTLILNKLKINDWSVIDKLGEFASLKHVRLQNIPLLNEFSDEEKYYLLVGYLDDRILSLNGSKITSEDKENCERKYIRHYLDVAQKPKRFYELENRHGKLNKLADVNLEANKRVNCKIKYRDQHIYHKVDVRQTVGDFKKQLEKFVGHPASRFKVFYIDIEACAIYGPEELKYTNRCLYSFNIVEGDEFEIDLKPVPVAYAASEHQFQHHANHNHHHHHSETASSPTKPLTIRNRKISESNGSSSGECYASRSCAKKTRPGSSNRFAMSATPTKASDLLQQSKVGDLKQTSGSGAGLVGDYCSLPASLNNADLEANNLIEGDHAAGNNNNEPNQLLVVFTAGNEEEISATNSWFWQ